MMGHMLWRWGDLSGNGGGSSAFSLGNSLIVSCSESGCGSIEIDIILRRFKEAASISFFFLSLTLSRRLCDNLASGVEDLSFVVCFLEP
jgi:hypothetical protein